MAEPRITQTTLYDSPWDYFANAKHHCEILTGSLQRGPQNTGGIGSAETVQDT